MITFNFTLWIRYLYYEFSINGDWDCSNDMPKFICKLEHNWKTILGIEVIKAYNYKYEWNQKSKYNPYFKKWRIKLTIGKFIKIFNNAMNYKL